MLACAIGHEKTVQTLINSNAGVNAQNLKGHTALMLASLCERQDIINILNGSVNI